MAEYTSETEHSVCGEYGAEALMAGASLQVTAGQGVEGPEVPVMAIHFSAAGMEQALEAVKGTGISLPPNSPGQLSLGMTLLFVWGVVQAFALAARSS